MCYPGTESPENLFYAGIGESENEKDTCFTMRVGNDSLRDDGLRSVQGKRQDLEH